MDKQFFLPVGRIVYVFTTDGKTITAFLEGMINFGGVPALYLSDSEDDEIIEWVIPIPHVQSLRVRKPNHTLIKKI
jgi:hypothetical protein